MKFKLSDLWRWDGTVERGPFLLCGVILFVVKFNLDRLVSWLLFERTWSVFDYQRAGESLWRTLPSTEDSTYFATLLALSLPFLWAGLVLVVKRLKSAGLPLPLVLLFFVPVLKLIFFAVLCVVPSREQRQKLALGPDDVKGWIGLLIPSSAVGSASVGILVTFVMTVAAAWLGTKVWREYGWSLFVGLPFTMGFISVLIYGYHERRRMVSCLLLAGLTIALAGLGLLLVAFEGIICLIMAAPLAISMAVAGGAVAHKIQSKSWWNGESTRLFCAVFLAVPAVMGVEHAQAPLAPLFAVKSSIVVNAPPERVWHHVISFSELPPPTELIFRLGVAYPIRAEIQGRGTGAVRHCIFSTGPFVEPIEVWDEPHLLRFSVTQNPEPMQEWTPYRKIYPPHLDGFLVSRQGQFLLKPLPAGRTQLEGTTWYHHTMWPAAYWQLWSDHIIHTIHLRVLKHIKVLAEKDAP